MNLTAQLKKYIRSLRLPKQRQNYNKFIAEGPKVCAEFLSSNSHPIEYLLCTEEYQRSHESKLQTIPASKQILISSKELSQLSLLRTPNKILLVLEKRYEENPDSLKDKKCIYLNGIQDPGNAGTIVRIADWYGLDYVISDADTADFYHPKVVQSAMGSHTRIRFCRSDFHSLKLDLSTAYGLDLSGQDINKFQPIESGMLVIGSESKGIHPTILQQLQNRVFIPRKGGAESLNAAVATGIACERLF